MNDIKEYNDEQQEITIQENDDHETEIEENDFNAATEHNE